MELWNCELLLTSSLNRKYMIIGIFNFILEKNERIG